MMKIGIVHMLMAQWRMPMPMGMWLTHRTVMHMAVMLVVNM